jgi:hypothetical protein
LRGEGKMEKNIATTLVVLMIFSMLAMLLIEVGASSVITATIDIEPNVLNLSGLGKWITAYIELQEDYNVNNINVSSISLNSTIPVDLSAPTAIGD